MSNLIKQYVTHFDTFFENASFLERISAKQYIALKKHIIETKETLGNLNYFLRETMKLDHETRREIIRLVEAYEFGDIDE